MYKERCVCCAQGRQRDILKKGQRERGDGDKKGR